MSLILDALRKVERERRRPTAAMGVEGRVARLEKSKRRRHHALFVAIALASAGLTAFVLTMLPSTSLEREAPPLPPETASHDPGEAVAERGGGESAPAATTRPTVPITSDSKRSSPASPRSARGNEAEAAPPQAPIVPEPEPVATRAPATGESVAIPEESASEESVTAFRLVGPGSSSALESDADASESSRSGAPFNLPPLVLQGTSVVDGHPVAVISDRRVFEGDTIEGAVVIRIEERSVELELEGRRFTLSL